LKPRLKAAHGRHEVRRHEVRLRELGFQLAQSGFVAAGLQARLQSPVPPTENSQALVTDGGGRKLPDVIYITAPLFAFDS
jgi:hypothetical protein